MAVVAALVGCAVVVLLTLVAGVIIAAQHQSSSRIATNFKSRGETAASFASDYVTGIANRETSVARHDFSGRTVDGADFTDVNAVFGFSGAVLLDHSGDALALTPSDPAKLGTQIAAGYLHLRSAEGGTWAVSNVVLSAVQRKPVVAVAVPFDTPSGRRVYSGALPISDSPLGQYLDHAIVTHSHNIYLIDANGTVIAENPQLSGATLAAAEPALARAVADASSGSFSRSGVATSYAVSRVAGTPWRLVLSEPSSVLYASTRGFTGFAPWIVFAVIAAVSLLLALLLIRSVRDRRSLAQYSLSMSRAAETDELTGLANRRRLVSVLRSGSPAGRAADRQAALLMIDLDKFKGINDNFGHEMGDRALVAVADAMRSVFRDGDVYGRWGGDEFLAILAGTTPDDAAEIAERLRSTLAQTTVSNGQLSVPIEVSVGVAAGRVDPDDLLRRADIALYAAKNVGGGTVVEERSLSSSA